MMKMQDEHFISDRNCYYFSPMKGQVDPEDDSELDNLAKQYAMASQNSSASAAIW